MSVLFYLDGKLKPISGKLGPSGKDGNTWKPTVAENGDLSWEKDNSENVPVPVNIKGKDGKPVAMSFEIDQAGDLILNYDEKTTSPLDLEIDQDGNLIYTF